MKRYWKLLDVGRLRLYQIEMKFMNHPEWNKTLIIAAKKPSHAAPALYKICIGGVLAG